MRLRRLAAAVCAAIALVAAYRLGVKHGKFAKRKGLCGLVWKGLFSLRYLCRQKERSDHRKQQRNTEEHTSAKT